ncbi:MAG TPA: glucoamylase family protein, partial [Agriterribacter sp.]|nr:glucoamylase family protein [Agriterribacter sp.]
SKRNLLQWNPYGNSVRSTPKTLSGNYLTMWVAPVFAAGILIYLLYASTLTAIVDLPVLISWILSPGIAYLISKPRKARRAALDADQTVFLRKLSRRIWAFFEKFVTDEDNWLPPDNYQKQPGPKIAHRTSPTNIGLSLLANLTAYDFGYISAGRLIDRTTRTFRTIQELEKYKGHLYNWYDTITLSCLQPRYISTVDSGNFIGHIITLKQGLLQLKDNRIFSARMLRGLSDTVALLLEKKEKDTLLQELKKDIEAAQSTPLHSLREIMATVERLKNKYYNIVRQYENAHDETDKKTREWLALLGVQLNDITGDLITLAPWLSLQPPSPAFHDMLNDMDHVPTLTQLCNIQTAALPGVKSFYRSSNTAAENNWLDMLVSHIIQASGRARERLQILEDLAGQCDEFSDAEYDFLYSKTQHLLAIGYNAEEHRLDNSYYDLLASEARLGNFVAIAQGKLPQESWFALGRQLTNLGSAPALLSWSGSMFEYLMPELVMPSYENTLLDQTHKAVVQKQIDYGNKKEVPWGISESGYNMIDAAMNYQYKAFGVPGTGFKRGLGEDLVISPYSSVMALMVMPEEACSNLQLMAKKGFAGTYGFFEAIDYTPSRLPRGQEHVIIQSFMAHHQGMSLLSLSHLLLNQPMQQRFISDVQFRATLLLLQERIPRVTALSAPGIHIADAGITSKEEDAYMRVINTPQTATPEIQLLSNGRYHVMISNAGSGYSRWKNIAVTRWREDSTCDNWGNFCFIRDLENNEFWSSAYQPALQNGDHYEAVFS